MFEMIGSKSGRLQVEVYIRNTPYQLVIFYIFSHESESI